MTTNEVEKPRGNGAEAQIVASSGTNLGKSDFADDLAGNGLTNESKLANVDVPITIIIGATVYQRVQKQSYKGVADKAGATKDLKE